MRAYRFTALATLLASPWVLAAEQGSVSPYIDQLKAKMAQEGKPTSELERPPGNPDPYIQSIRQKMRESGKETEAPQGTQPYIEKLKAEDPSLNQAPKTAGYAEEQKAKLPAEERGSAIEAYQQGKSDLKLKRPGHINAGVGIKVGGNISHNFSGSSNYVTNNFQTIYGSGWVPDLTLIAEYKPFYSETYGSLGFIASGGVSIFKGNGRFAQTILMPNQTSSFPMNSRTKLTFLSVPATIGAKYQFNLSHIIRPYALAGPTLIGISEARNDGIGAKYALSKGITTSVGAAFLLDWISGNNTWNLYQDFGVKHFYLTVEYTKLTTISSPVDVSYSGLNAGFTYDF